MEQRPGIEYLFDNYSALLKGKRLGLVVNQASVLSDFSHTIFYLQRYKDQYHYEIKAVFGPQHGIWGHTQANMIEWESYQDRRFQFPFYSLYGKNRKIPPEILRDIDIIIYDLQDVGTRYYTFIWTLAMVMSSLDGTDIPLIVADRPNPINGVSVEGPVLDMKYSSFVGIHPLPIRHGMTVCEIASYFKGHFYPDVKLYLLPMAFWDRTKYLDQLTYPWVPPSPNMPGINTALVYPGSCLIEATNVSEGRGTTTPFEVIGAPWIDGLRLSRHLNSISDGAQVFRFHVFEPTFDKYEGKICEGIQIHIMDRTRFHPFKTGLIILRALIELYSDHFMWKEPPYEYEYEKMPIDILLGCGWIRQELEKGTPYSEIESCWKGELSEFMDIRERYLIYK